MVRLIASFALALFLVSFLPGQVEAQLGGWVFSQRGSARAHGEYITGWNTTGTEIKDGTVVMADTSGVGTVPGVAVGKGFKGYDGSSLNTLRILGVLMGDCPGFQQCRILTKGFYPAVKLDKTGITGNSFLKPSLTHAGRLTNWAVSESTYKFYTRPCGIFQRYAYTDSLVGYAWIDFNVH